GAIGDNPVTSVFGNTRANVPARQVAVDSAGTGYIITLTGLTVVPLGTSKPQVASGVNGLVNATDGSRSFGPGSFIAASGSNLASTAASDTIPPPALLGGSCLTFSDASLPLLQTSSGQIVAQIPSDLSPGQYVMRVRSLATGQQSDAVMVTVQRR